MGHAAVILTVLLGVVIPLVLIMVLATWISGKQQRGEPLPSVLRWPYFASVGPMFSGASLLLIGQQSTHMRLPLTIVGILVISLALVGTWLIWRQRRQDKLPPTP